MGGGTTGHLVTWCENQELVEKKATTSISDQTTVRRPNTQRFSSFILTEPKECFLQWVHQIFSGKHSFGENTQDVGKVKTKKKRAGQCWPLCHRDRTIPSPCRVFWRNRKKQWLWAYIQQVCLGKGKHKPKSWEGFRSLCLVFSDSLRQEVSKRSHDIHRKTLHFLLTGNSSSFQRNPDTKYQNLVLI